MKRQAPIIGTRWLPLFCALCNIGVGGVACGLDLTHTYFPARPQTLPLKVPQSPPNAPGRQRHPNTRPGMDQRGSTIHQGGNAEQARGDCAPTACRRRSASKVKPTMPRDRNAAPHAVQLGPRRRRLTRPKATRRPTPSAKAWPAPATSAQQRYPKEPPKRAVAEPAAVEKASPANHQTTSKQYTSKRWSQPADQHHANQQPQHRLQRLCSRTLRHLTLPLSLGRTVGIFLQRAPHHQDR